MDSRFDLEELYKRFLEMVKLNEDMMSPIEKIERRRAFMGGVSAMIILMHDHISGMPEDEAVKALQSLQDQAKQYWNDQAKQYWNAQA